MTAAARTSLARARFRVPFSRLGASAARLGPAGTGVCRPVPPSPRLWPLSECVYCPSRLWMLTLLFLVSSERRVPKGIQSPSRLWMLTLPTFRAFLPLVALCQETRDPAIGISLRPRDQRPAAGARPGGPGPASGNRHGRKGAGLGASRQAAGRPYVKDGERTGTRCQDRAAARRGTGRRGRRPGAETPGPAGLMPPIPEAASNLMSPPRRGFSSNSQYKFHIHGQAMCNCKKGWLTKSPRDPD